MPCICTRWSDSDVGCATCNGRGLMACSSCGGGGTAVPITAKLISRRYSAAVGCLHPTVVQLTFCDVACVLCRTASAPTGLSSGRQSSKHDGESEADVMFAGTRMTCLDTLVDELEQRGIGRNNGQLETWKPQQLVLGSCHYNELWHMMPTKLEGACQSGLPETRNTTIESVICTCIVPYCTC